MNISFKKLGYTRIKDGSITDTYTKPTIISHTSKTRSIVEKAIIEENNNLIEFRVYPNIYKMIFNQFQRIDYYKAGVLDFLESFKIPPYLKSFNKYITYNRTILSRIKRYDSIKNKMKRE